MEGDIGAGEWVGARGCGLVDGYGEALCRRGTEELEGGGADLDVEFFAGEFDGVDGGVLFVEVDELLFLVAGEFGENGVDAAGWFGRGLTIDE